MSEDPVNSIDKSRRSFLKAAGAVPAGLYLPAYATAAERSQPTGQPDSGGGSMMNHIAPSLVTVRVGVIGAGRRGSTIMRLLTSVDGIEIKAVCDPYALAIENARALLTEAGASLPAFYGNGDHDYRKMLERDDIDAVFVLTPWSWHTPMAVDVMDSGKHAFVEVPAAVTLEQAWQLVETSEKTRMNCMMMENVCYGREELMALNMVRQGVLGELLHGEAAYIHELRWQMKDVDEGTGSWRTGWHERHNGNLYPTHGLGPIAQYMDINRGDRFDFLNSMSSPALGRQLYAEREFPPEHQRNQVRYICGDMNTSLIKTVKGRTIMVQHDTTTPRPYSRHNLIAGTGGVVTGFPNRIALESEGTFHEWQHDMSSYYERYDHPLWKRIELEALAAGGHGGMDYVMLWRLTYCLRNGVPLDQNVYDAAAWSSVAPLSESSNADRGNSKDFPDFTRGAWSSSPPLAVGDAMLASA